LEGTNWEVGLISATIPFTWCNVDKSVRFLVIFSEADVVGANRYPPVRNLTDSPDSFLKAVGNLAVTKSLVHSDLCYVQYLLPPGLYSSRQEVGRTIASGLSQLLARAGVVVSLYEWSEDRFSFGVQGVHVRLFMGDPWLMRDVLGFEIEQVPEPTNGSPVFMVSDLTNILNNKSLMKEFLVPTSIELYCDAVEPYAHGSQRTSQLATISVEGVKHGMSFTFLPSAVEYYPVSNDRFSNIEVKLTYNNGELVAFRNMGVGNPVSVKLRFRQKLFGGI
jgi:hypothetical protein